MLKAISILAIVLSIIFAGTLVFFMRNLRWDCKEDRFAICGFVSMIVVLMLNIVLIGVLMR